MSAHKGELLPLEPLKDAMQAESWLQLARRLGLSYRTVCRWRKAGGVSAWRADELAVRCAHKHPYDIWGHDFDRPELWPAECLAAA